MAVRIKAEGFANGVPCPIAGQYVKSFDFEADDGRGYGEFTLDPAKALTFESLSADAAYADAAKVLHGDFARLK